MTQTGTAARANALGQPCPRWCSADHARHDTHMSDPMTRDFPWLVRLVQYGQRHGQPGPSVSVSMSGACTQICALDAAFLPELLDALAGLGAADIRQLADEVRAAVLVLDQEDRANALREIREVHIRKTRTE